MNNFLYVLIVVCMMGCSEDIKPKPNAYLSLSYPKKEYHRVLVTTLPYSFEVAQQTEVITLPKQWLKIKYPSLKASIDITYRPVNDNLKELLMESEKLVFEHTIKADQIGSKTFENATTKVYGTMYDIKGNSASQVQFHVTDSATHFLKASLFFYSKPNYDSILPAVVYIKEDMIRMMETMEWQK